MNSRLQAPKQWTPSCWFLPMMQFRSVPPAWTKNTASESPPSPEPQAPEPRSYLAQPQSKTWPDLTVIGAEFECDAVAAGTPPS